MNPSAPEATAMPTAQGVRLAQAPTFKFMLQHPAHAIALGFGSGLAPKAPGTFGTLFAWLSFVLLNPWVGPLGAWGWPLIIGVGLVLGIWACMRTAQHLGQADPGAIVWDEIMAFWAVLWLVTPAAWWVQLCAFGFFRYFDAAKPGPVRWADQRYKHHPMAWVRAWGILVDDLVAALCTLLVMALAVWVQIYLGGGA